MRFFKELFKRIQKQKGSVAPSRPILQNENINPIPDDESFKFSQDEGHHPKMHEHNYQKRQKRFAEAQLQKKKWFLECADLWDYHDADGGVYFSSYDSNDEVAKSIRFCQKNSGSVAIYGIYNTDQSLLEQGPGLKPEEWERKYIGKSH
jgi:hypothetical protein